MREDYGRLEYWAQGVDLYESGTEEMVQLMTIITTAFDH
jgi:hypothetical protein